MRIKHAIITLVFGVVSVACGDDGDDGCPAGSFSCADGLSCIEPSEVCDQSADCLDGSDELDCGGCALDEWECDNQQCVLTSQLCDGTSDCSDGSDEQGCSCDPVTEFECGDGSCIAVAGRCNGTDDCAGGEDEAGCNCDPVTEFECGDGSCIAVAGRCDGTDDCAGGEDEAGCSCDPLAASTCAAGEKCGAWYATSDFGDPDFRCVPDGSQQTNETCALSQQPGGFADTCAAGSLCMPTPDGNAACFAMCDSQGTGTECTVGQPTCAQPYAADPVGICTYCSGEYVTQAKTQELRLYYDDSHNQELAPGAGMNTFVQIAGASNVDVSNINDSIRGVCLSDCDILFISTPKTLFTQAEKTAVIDYLNNGGRVLFTIDDDVHSDLVGSEANDILSPFGLAFGALTGLNTDAFTYAGTAVTPVARNITYIFGRTVSGGTPFIEINASGGLISGAYTDVGTSGRLVVVSENTPFIDAFINNQDNAAFTADVLQWLLN